MLKKISLFLVQALLLEQVAFANPDIFKPSKLDLSERAHVSLRFPESVATIEDAYKAGNKTIYLMQDAHTNDSGQINLARALDEIFRQEKGVKYVFTEAAEGDNSLTSLRQAKTAPERQRLAASYIRKGLLHGSEYLDITSQHELVIWGVENPELYAQALEDYKAVVKDRERFQDYLSRIAFTIRTLKQRVLNPALQDFDTKHEKYEKEEIGLTDYFGILSRQAEKLQISLSAYPHLSRLNELQNKEAAIDFKIANEEQVKAVAALEAAHQEELIAASEENKNSPFKLTSNDQKEKKAFYALLEEKLGLTAYAKYPELAKYFQYLKLAKALDAKALLKEVKLLETQVYSKLIKTEDERNFIRASHTQKLLNKLFLLSLTPEEFEEYRELTRGFDIAHMTGFLNKMIRDLKTYYDSAVFLEPGYEDMVRRSEGFYELTATRDLYFVEKMLEKMAAEKQDKAVLITGGFHTPNLKSLLKKNNISYISITPQVLQATNQKRYESILVGQSLAKTPVMASGIATSTVMTTHVRAGGSMPQVMLAGRPFAETVQADFGARLVGLGLDRAPDNYENQDEIAEQRQRQLKSSRSSASYWIQQQRELGRQHMGDPDDDYDYVAKRTADSDGARLGMVGRLINNYRAWRVKRILTQAQQTISEWATIEDNGAFGYYRQFVLEKLRNADTELDIQQYHFASDPIYFARLALLTLITNYTDTSEFNVIYDEVEDSRKIVIQLNRAVALLEKLGRGARLATVSYTGNEAPTKEEAQTGEDLADKVRRLYYAIAHPRNATDREIKNLGPRDFVTYFRLLAMSREFDDYSSNLKKLEALGDISKLTANELEKKLSGGARLSDTRHNVMELREITQFFAGAYKDVWGTGVKPNFDIPADVNDLAGKNEYLRKHARHLLSLPSNYSKDVLKKYAALLSKKENVDALNKFFGESVFTAFREALNLAATKTRYRSSYEASELVGANYLMVYEKAYFDAEVDSLAKAIPVLDETITHEQLFSELKRSFDTITASWNLHPDIRFQLQQEISMRLYDQLLVKASVKSRQVRVNLTTSRDGNQSNIGTSMTGSDQRQIIAKQIESGVPMKTMETWGGAVIQSAVLEIIRDAMPEDPFFNLRQQVVILKTKLLDVLMPGAANIYNISNEDLNTILDRYRISSDREIISENDLRIILHRYNLMDETTRDEVVRRYNIRQEMLLRGQYIVGLEAYPDEVLKLFIETAYAYGLDTFRIFDAINDKRNILPAIRYAKEVGAKVQPVLHYSPVFPQGIEGYVNLAKEYVEAAGEALEAITIKDAAGLLEPSQAYLLVKALRDAGLTCAIQIHTHDTKGDRQLTLFEAIRANGEKYPIVVDVAVGKDMLSAPFAQPDALDFFNATQRTPWQVDGLTAGAIKKIEEMEDYIRTKIMPRYKKRLYAPSSDRFNIVRAHLPGGMKSNFIDRQIMDDFMDKTTASGVRRGLAATAVKPRYGIDMFNSAGELTADGSAFITAMMDLVYDEMIAVRQDTGDIGLVTPTSQWIGVQAFQNVLIWIMNGSVTLDRSGSKMKLVFKNAPETLSQSLAGTNTGKRKIEQFRATQYRNSQPIGNLHNYYLLWAQDTELQKLYPNANRVLVNNALMAVLADANDKKVAQNAILGFSPVNTEGVAEALQKYQAVKKALRKNFVDLTVVNVTKLLENAAKTDSKVADALTSGDITREMVLTIVKANPDLNIPLNREELLAKYGDISNTDLLLRALFPKQIAHMMNLREVYKLKLDSLVSPQNRKTILRTLRKMGVPEIELAFLEYRTTPGYRSARIALQNSSPAAAYYKNTEIPEFIKWYLQNRPVTDPRFENEVLPFIINAVKKDTPSLPPAVKKQILELSSRTVEDVTIYDRLKAVQYVTINDRLFPMEQIMAQDPTTYAPNVDINGSSVSLQTKADVELFLEKMHTLFSWIAETEGDEYYRFDVTNGLKTSRAYKITVDKDTLRIKSVDPAGSGARLAAAIKPGTTKLERQAFLELHKVLRGSKTTNIQGLIMAALDKYEGNKYKESLESIRSARASAMVLFAGQKSEVESDKQVEANRLFDVIINGLVHLTGGSVKTASLLNDEQRVAVKEAVELLSKSLGVVPGEFGNKVKVELSAQEKSADTPASFAVTLHYNGKKTKPVIIFENDAKRRSLYTLFQLTRSSLSDEAVSRRNSEALGFGPTIGKLYEQAGARLASYSESFAKNLHWLEVERFYQANNYAFPENKVDSLFDSVPGDELALFKVILALGSDKAKIKAIKYMGKAKLKEALPILVYEQVNPYSRLDEAAANAIKDIGPSAEEYVSALINILRLEKSGTPIYKAVRAALAESARKNPDRVVPGLSDGGENVRFEIAQILGEEGVKNSQKAVTALREHVNDSDANVRDAVFRTLHKRGGFVNASKEDVIFGELDYVNGLAHALESSASPGVRVIALKALGLLNERAQRVVYDIAKVLRSEPEYSVRSVAIETLIGLGEVGVHVLRSQILYDTEAGATVKGEVASALRTQGARLSIAPVTSTTFSGSTQSFFTNVGAFVRSGTEVRLALAEETLNVYTLRNDAGKLVVIEGARRAVLDLKSGLSKEAQAKDLEGIRQDKGLTEKTSELRALNSARGPLTKGGEPALFLIDISSFTGLESPKAEFENLLIQQDRKLDGLSRVAFVGTEDQVKTALRLVETLSLKHKDQFSSFDAVSKDFSKSPRIALVKQGYTLPDNLGYDYKVTLQSEKNGQTGVFAFGAIQALMEYAAQDNLEEAFKLFLTLAPSYRGRITFDQFKRFLEGDEEVISEFPLPATIWASLQDAVKLYQLSRTVAYSA